MEVLSLLLVFDAVLGGLSSYAIEMGGPEDTHHFSCSTQLSMEFQLLIKTKMLKKIITFLAFKHSNATFIVSINVKMPTNVGILTFLNMINVMLS